MVHALGQVLSLLLYFWHLLCLDFPVGRPRPSPLVLLLTFSPAIMYDASV
jgi:hypothetical protein